MNRTLMTIGEPQSKGNPLQFIAVQRFSLPRSALRYLGSITTGHLAIDPSSA
jgi:hypothetical protein